MTMTTVMDEEMKGDEAVKKNLPWVEKYRPSTLDELISHDDIIQTIQRFVQNDTFPHLLFYGPPGTGKTSTILAAARQLYPEQVFASMVLELNASDDRGIGIVRNDILNFAEARPVFTKQFKLIILDEADAMTNDAQNALRRIMEKHTNVTRFCIICNYLSKIIPAIQSRCTRFRFAPLNNEQIIPRLDFIMSQEGIRADLSAKETLISLAKGDMRRVINTLQSTNMAFKKVTTQTILQTCAQPTVEEMDQIVTILKDDTSLKDNFNKIWLMQQMKGFALQDLITRLQPMVMGTKFDELETVKKMDLLEDMATVEVQLASGGNEKLQTASLVSSFYEVALALWND